MNSLLSQLLKRIVWHGSLTVTDANGRDHVFGDGTGELQHIVLHDSSVERRLLRDPELTLGEAYMDGEWSIKSGSLTALLTLFMANLKGSAPPSRLRRLMRLALRRVAQRNTARAARKNATHHYDVGNEIYTLFLDEDWQYSCAYFPSADASLEEAQLAKKRHIAAKMLLEPGHRVLDIGCGWGGMALYLNEFTGAEVTGITLADNQVARARERAKGRTGLDFRVQDYRAVPETFDRIVSVGMFEHVGVGYFDDYFQAAHRLLEDDGVMLLHSIGRFDGPGSTNPFIAKYIFPGGYIPALSEVLPAIERAGLYVTDVEILRLHYAETLKNWNARFHAHHDEVVKEKDERFFRMWDFYLAGSEASFRAGDMMVFQIQLAKRLETVPLTRDYMASTERALAARDSGRSTGPALIAGHG
ncbi:SAM-dependent methyltransferase [Acuticoccus mangrovi]|uniref:Class I SAM-dependent methyltransferase n=1 Tax=Acuticoccus mangrovi TaxID=2796142 RepID=A0A934IMN8_9HYPH|nr:cyclopropane-fatty-acyl-phospholipid synthase family protein [Acuticoccus mangrovi]MBJ3776657.1 class I SAM-dependent methyltransferase [Acuticoccus mangrovi]